MPKDLVASDGAVAWSAAHSAYGRVVATYTDDAARARHGTTVSSPFRMLGQVADDEAELCWTRFRCCDPETGTWISTDPLEMDGGLNLYGLDGAPTVVVDPRGLAGNPHVAREAEIQPNKHHKAGAPMTEAEAVEHVRSGGDVIARDRNTAARIAAQAGNQSPIHHNPHGEGQLPHYHPVVDGEKQRGHVLY